MTRMTQTQQLKDSYRRVKDTIAKAAERSGRRPDSVLTVAVTKTASPDQIRSLVELGHADLGENRVQQLIQRSAGLEEFLKRRRILGDTVSRSAAGAGQFPDHVRWHMIGTLQRNKVKQVVPLVQLIHSVDSLRLTEEIHTFAVRADTTVDILIQVNATGAANRHGVAVAAVLHLAEQIDSMVHLRLRGLMMMGALSDDPEDSRPAMARTAEVFHELCSSDSAASANFSILSMGMSNDYQVAIEEGANLVRIGRAIFGEDDEVSARRATVVSVP
jgi:pyridoxal phosphate enzyme (YggS family)